jgi:hypothetical protein
MKEEHYKIDDWIKGRIQRREEVFIAHTLIENYNATLYLYLLLIDQVS